MKDMEFAIAALKRMSLSADNDTKIITHFTSDIEDINKEDFDDTWIITAQSQKQIKLLKEHKKKIPIFVEGPFIAWIRSKIVEYFVMKTDPDPEIIEKIRHNENFNDSEENLKNLHNMFSDPFKESDVKSKKIDLSVHQMADGTVFAMCCTGTGTKTSLYCWTKILEKQIEELKDFVIVYKIKPKPNFLVDLDKLKQKDEKSENH